MTDALACNPLSAAFNHAPRKPIAVVLPALLFAWACYGSVVAYIPTKTGCDGDTMVSVANGGWAHWLGKGGDISFQILNKPTPKNVCVRELNKEQTLAFDAEQKLSWDDFNKWKSQQHNG